MPPTKGTAVDKISVLVSGGDPQTAPRLIRYPEERAPNDPFPQEHGRVITRPTPEQLEKLGVVRDDEWLDTWLTRLGERGVAGVAFDTHHATRLSPDTGREMPHWEAYMPQLAREGLLAQFIVNLHTELSLGLPQDTSAGDRSRKLAEVLSVREGPNLSAVGELADQAAAVVENLLAGAHLPLTVAGIGRYPSEQVATITRNVMDIFRSAAANRPSA